MRNLTDLFIEAIKTFSLQQFSPMIYRQVRACLLDFLACSLAGQKYYSDRLADLIEGVDETGPCSIIGVNGIKMPMQDTTLINGISAHAIELDDGHRIGMVHLAAPIISAITAVAEKENLSSKDIFYGIIIGYEVAIRLACCVQPGCKLKGYHATGTCGTLGTAMAIATALHFDTEQMKSALSAAITSAAGVLEMIEGDTEMKPFNAGRAAMDGVTAAYIGKARFKAPEDALGGKRGFLKVMTDQPKLDFLTNFNNEKLMIETIYMKPYAACRHCHPSIEAALNIRKMEGFKIEDVKEIHVDTYKLAVAGHDHTIISGTNSAKMSIPYSLSVALCYGKAGLNEYTEEYISDEQVQRITQKVTIDDVDELTALCPQRRVAIVNVKTSADVYTQRVDFPKGEPENPLTKEELEEKFRSLAMYGGLSSQDCDELIQEIWKPEINLNKILKIVCK